MKKYNSFKNESNNSPYNVDIDELATKMKEDAKKLWFKKLDSILLNKAIKFRGTKWSQPHVSWQDYVVTVKKIDKNHSSLYGSEFTIIDTNNTYYTVLATIPIRIYDNINDYNADIKSKKYNL
jgi:hypothetical protein